MPIMTDALFVAACYFVGAFPQLRMLGLMCGKRIEGDMHQQLWWQCGPAVGLTGILLDVAKGTVVVAVGRALGFELAVIVLGGLAVLAGQMWSVFYGFNGEKGNTTALGFAIILTPVSLLIAAIPIAVGAAMRLVPHFARQSGSVARKFKFKGPPSRSLPLGVLIGFGLLPLIAWLRVEATPVILGYIALFLLLVIRRLTASSANEKHGVPFVKKFASRLLYDR
jgi:glycerol-3-phosphate acyltransferase PlsY